jgi:hypothetical protein
MARKQISKVIPLAESSYWDCFAKSSSFPAALVAADVLVLVFEAFWFGDVL